MKPTAFDIAEKYLSTPTESASQAALADDTNPWAAPEIIAKMIEGDEIVTVLIQSTILNAPIWFSFRDSWKPEQGVKTPVFYASELPALRTKSPQQLRQIFKVKAAFGGGILKR